MTGFTLLLFASAFVQVEDRPVQDFGPTCSRDGETVVYYSYRPETRLPDLYLARGNAPEHRLTDTTDVWEIEPDFSPADANMIAYAAGPSMSALSIWIMNLETGEAQPLIEHENSLSSPQWAPDGRMIAATERQGTPAELDIVLFDLSDSHAIRPFGNRPGARFNAAWSPDGNRLAFIERVDSIANLFVLDLRRETITQLTDDAIEQLLPVWIPDGSALIVSEIMPEATRLVRYLAAPTTSPHPRDVLLEAPGVQIYFKDICGASSEIVFDQGTGETGFSIHRLLIE